MTATTALGITGVDILILVILVFIHAYIGNSECNHYQLFCFIVINHKSVTYFISSLTWNDYGKK